MLLTARGGGLFRRLLYFCFCARFSAHIAVRRTLRVLRD
jgi:hypothetical protein